MTDTSYVLFADACCDLTYDLVQEIGLQIVPMGFEMDGKVLKHYGDFREIDIHEFFERMRKGTTVKTSQANPSEYIDLFTPYLEKGIDIIYVGFSSALSGTVNSGFQAASLLKDTFPDRKIKVIDSLCASGGIALLVYYMGLNQKEGMSFDDNVRWCETHMMHMAHWFTVDDLYALKRGGRLSASAAFLGSLLKIKPVLHVDNLGRLVPVEKVRGRKQAILTIMQHCRDTVIDPEKNIILINHADDEVTAHYLGELVEKEFHPKRIIYTSLGPIIGGHTGANTFSLYFFATER